MSNVLLDTHDLGEAEEVFSRVFAPIRVTARERDKPTRTYLRHAAIGSSNIIAEHLGYNMDYVMAPPEWILLGHVRSGTMTLRSAGEPARRFGPGQTTAAGTVPGQPFGGSLQQCRVDVFLVDRALLGETAAGSPQDEAPVRLTGSVPVSDAAGRQLAAALDYLRSAAVHDPSAMQNPLIAGAAQRYLAASMLAAYPNTAVVEPTTVDRRDSTPALLHRAIAFIDENVHRDISLTGIAAAVHITPRALQYMFRKHRDCTPMEYLRQARLHRVHADLTTADPTATTVRDVAHRWGFGHLGRFAVHYRTRYGQSPHVTLHG